MKSRTTIKLITRETVAEKLAAHLRHELSLDSLVAWAKSVLMDGEFDPAHLPPIRDLVTRIGIADVYAFGSTWEDCESFFPNSAIPHKSEFRQIVSCSTR